MSNTAFLCATCGDPVEAKNPLVYRLMMQGKTAMCHACVNGHESYSEMSREQYYKTQRWKDNAKQCKQDAEWRCQICYATPPLEAHHRVYIRLGHELPSDLTALCKPCHVAATALQYGLIDIDDLLKQVENERDRRKMRGEHGVEVLD